MAFTFALAAASALRSWSLGLRHVDGFRAAGGQQAAL
jgi:hypothetical protein